MSEDCHESNNARPDTSWDHGDFESSTVKQVVKARYVATQNTSSLHRWWTVIDTESDAATVVSFHSSVPNAEEEAKSLCDRLNGVNKIGGAPRDLTMVEVVAMFHRINRKLNEIRKDTRRSMTTGKESPLDQALDSLETAATNKVAEDQVVDGLAAQAQDETAETARIAAVAAELNTETAAEQAIVAAQTPATPAPTTPAPSTPAAGSTTGN